MASFRARAHFQHSTSLKSSQAPLSFFVEIYNFCPDFWLSCPSLFSYFQFPFIASFELAITYRAPARFFLLQIDFP